MQDLERELKELEAKEREVNKRIFKDYNGKKILKRLDRKLKDVDFKIKASNMRYMGHRVLQVNVHSNKYGRYEKFNRAQIMKIGKVVSKTLQKNNVTGLITTGLRFGDKDYRSGMQTQIGDDIDIFDGEEYDETYAEKYKAVKSFGGMSFYIFVNPPRAGGKDKYNDCLYNCIKYYIPKYNPFSSPEEMKRFLKIGRLEPVPLEALPALEDKLKVVGINVSGDHIYTSKYNLNRNINLKLFDGHYTIDHKLNNKVSYVSFHERRILLQDKETFNMYDGVKEFTITKEELDDIINFKTEYILVPRTKNYKLDENGKPLKDENGKKIRLTIQEDYELYIKIADDLKQATNGEINMYKTGTMRRTALQLFDKLTKFISPDPIEQAEAMWIREATAGAITFATPYEGPGYKWDIKSMYPSILSSNNFLVPVKAGEFKRFTLEQFIELKFLPTGIYKIKIESSNDDNINRQFRFKATHKYTNISIKHAEKLGLKMELIIDDEPNALVYLRKQCLTGSEVFKTYCDYLFPHKENKLLGAKLLLNMISGAIGEINDRLIEVNEAEGAPVIELPEDYTIVDVKEGNHTKQTTLYYVVKNDNFFKSRFARLKPFMLAKGRSIMTDFILPHNDKVVKCNTDSIIATEFIDYKTGSKMGDLVYEGACPAVIIKNNAKEIGEFKK